MKILEDGTISITVSGLMDFCKSPAHYKCFHIDNKRKESPALVEGKLLHLSIFEPDRFEKEYYSEITIPEEFTMLKTVDQIKSYLDSRDVIYKKSLDKTELIDLAHPMLDEWTFIWDKYIEQFSDKQNIPIGLYEKIVEMTKSVHNHAFFKKYVGSGTCEEKLTTMINGIQIRGRIDWYFFNERLNHYIITDLKKTKSSQLRAFERTIWDYKYFIQAYLYSKLVEDNFKKESIYTYIAVEPALPHIAEVYCADEGHMSAGEEYALLKIEQLKECIKNNYWPGYTDGNLTNIGLPNYAFDIISEELSNVR